MNRATTTGEICRRLGEPLHRVQYIISSRGIEPTARAGNLRLFSETDVTRIAAELQAIDSERRLGQGQ